MYASSTDSLFGPRWCIPVGCTGIALKIISMVGVGKYTFGERSDGFLIEVVETDKITQGWHEFF